MARAVALLRGINVGGRTANKAQLAGVLTSLGLTGVSTFIASGNVLFDLDPGPTGKGPTGKGPTGKGPTGKGPTGKDSLTEADRADLEARIETGLQAALGFAVVTFVRTAAEVSAAAGLDAFPGTDPTVSRHVGFLKTIPSAAVRDAVAALSTDRDVLSIHDRELWWLAHDGVGRSALKPGALDKAAGQPVTARNVTTVRKLADLLRG